MNSTTTDNHWHNHSKQWDKLGSPLRPNHEDLSFYKKYMSAKSRSLILGLTPEFCSLPGESLFVNSCGERIKLLFKEASLKQRVIQQDTSATYSSPSLAQLKTIWPDFFSKKNIHYGSYELAESCPIVVWGKSYD